MSKSGSGLFTGTFGDKEITEKTHQLIDENTAEVWNHITVTQPSDISLPIPKSFILSTKSGKYWVNPNGTKHIIDELTSSKTRHQLKQANPNLYSQFLLFDYYKSVNRISSRKILYGEKIVSGNWEFIFAEARNGGKYPVIKHAQFTGWRN
jgi:hypothetical protein